MSAQNMLIIDDRKTDDLRSAFGIEWDLITDGVMGGVSKGELSLAMIEDRHCIRMQGDVSLENNGGFVQLALDLPNDITQKIMGYSGLMIEVYGNDEQYNVHLRTQDIWLPWQSYRITFTATPEWQILNLPFAEFTPYRIEKELNIKRLKRIGIVAIGREFRADLCIGKIGFYK